MFKRIISNRLFRIINILVFFAIVLMFTYNKLVQVEPPIIESTIFRDSLRTEIALNHYSCGKCWLKKNKYDLWEMYLEGNDFDLGNRNGILTKDLIYIQELAFVDRLREMVPSEKYLNFLKYFVAWFNRNIDEYIPIEYQREIYGVSLHTSKEFDFVSPAYHRMLNYHGAHDIGHVLENLNLVGCTAFSVKNARSEDSSLIIGRNMDFYVGDAFAINKIIAFYKPDYGHKFCMVTWASMIGVTSGMNDQGLTITLNSAKSSVPTTAKMPVSLLARRILQYSSTIDEAYKIASEAHVFVSEMFLIGSGKENRVAVIEKTPNITDLYETNSDVLVLTNHFQGKKLKDTKYNKISLNESASLYRWNRVNELLEKKKKHSVKSFATILRDQKGLNNSNIGMGNEKAINQLIAHHSVIFKPKKLQIWISANPFQLGAYVCYDLNTIFSDTSKLLSRSYDQNSTLAADTFLTSQNFQNFQSYKNITSHILKANKAIDFTTISDTLINRYFTLNPEYYYPYFIAGEYYRLKKQNSKAFLNYSKALTKEIPKKAEKDQVLEMLYKLKD